MSGEPAAQAEWIRDVLSQHEGALLRYAFRLTGDLEQARDVVQETLLRLCRTDPATVDGHVGPWLFRVCRQRAMDLKRKENRMPASASHSIDSCPTGAPGPADSAVHAEDRRGMLRLVAELTPNQQDVVRLKFQAGLSYREISTVTGLSVSNVGFLLHTALVRLRERAAREDSQHECNGSHHRSGSPAPCNDAPALPSGTDEQPTGRKE